MTPWVRIVMDFCLIALIAFVVTITCAYMFAALILSIFHINV